jgi:spore coat protein U-like protein
MKRRLVAVFLMLAGSAAHAGCSVSSPGLNFGAYDPFASSEKLGAGTITVNCSLATVYTVALSAGQGTFAQRAMKNGGSTLNYNLYLDVTRLTVWGDGSSSTGVNPGVGTGLDGTFTAYGKMPAQQNVRSGTYTDSVVITVAF